MTITDNNHSFENVAEMIDNKKYGPESMSKSVNRGLNDALWDLRGIVSSFELWTFLARLDIRKRYARSVLGPLWLVVINAIYIFSLAFVFSILFKIKGGELLPWIAIGVTFWNFIGSFLIESSSNFATNNQIICQERVSFSALMASCLFKNFLIVAHNFIVLPIIMVFFSVPLNYNILWLLAGLPMFIIILYPVGFIIGILSTRLRDIPPLIQGLMTIGFFLTPVMWLPEQVSSHAYVYDYNLFAQMLEIVRSPLLGQAPSLWSFAYTTAFAIVFWAMLIFFLARYRNRIAYWI